MKDALIERRLSHYLGRWLKLKIDNPGLYISKVSSNGVHDWPCVEAAQMYNLWYRMEYSAANRPPYCPQRRRELYLKYKERYKKKAAYYRKRWATANRDKIREYNRKYNAKRVPGAYLESRRKWAAANQSLLESSRKAWVLKKLKTQPGYYKILYQKYKPKIYVSKYGEYGDARLILNETQRLIKEKRDGKGNNCARA